MAGGRRPANFSSSSRHVGGEAHQAAASAAYNYSIWQQPHLQTSPTSTQRPVSLPSFPPYIRLPTGSPAPAAPAEPLTPAATPLPADIAADVADTVAPTVASALASALDAAVRTVVSEHMSVALAAAAKRPAGDVGSADPADSSSPFSVGSSLHQQRRSGDHRFDNASSQDDHVVCSATSASFNHVVGSSRDSSVSNGDISASEWQVESEAHERKRDVDAVRAQLQQMEARFEARLEAAEKAAAGKAEKAAAREKERSAVLAARVEAQEEALRKCCGEVEGVQKALKTAQKALADARVGKRKSESDSERLRTRVADLEALVEGVGGEVHAVRVRLDEMEKKVVVEAKAKARKVREEEREKEKVAGERAVKAADEAERNAAETAESVAALRARLKRVEEMASKGVAETSTELALQHGAIERLRGSAADMGASLQGLKRLVETNLRSHSAAEGIVKDQAQLITRHVCVALRQFIARRITENNQLIDKTLRARVPAYGESNSSFVLVRSETENGSDGAPVLSTATSAVSPGGDMVENAAVYPLDAVEDALAGGDTAMAALQ